MSKRVVYNGKQTTYSGLPAYWEYTGPRDYLRVDTGAISLGNYAPAGIINKFAAKTEVLYKPVGVGSIAIKNIPGGVHTRTTR